MYGLTGFTGILAEQGFERYVALLLGNTASASAVVLFAYFLGFALGGVAAGSVLKRGLVCRPLLAYGVVELCAGASCVAFSYAFHGLMEQMAPIQNLFAGPALKFGMRFACGCLLVLPTAALMGASFPLMASALDKLDSSGRKRWSRAYEANLAGALAAALAAPFAILPTIGLRGALWVCGAICCGVCLLSAALSQPAGIRTHRAVQRPAPSRGIHLLLMASFASGAVFFALEVIWTHLIGIVIGSSIYAFSWMLAAVLLGLLLGAVLVNRSSRGGRMMSLSRLFQYAALVLLVQLILWDQAPTAFTIPVPLRFQNSFYFAEFFKLGLTIALLAPAATILGLIYPRLLVSEQLQGEENAHLAGYVSAANSVGCLLGAVLGIFFFVPVMGSEGALKLMVVMLAALWLLFLRHEQQARGRVRLAAACALAAVILMGSSHWDWWNLISGRGNYFGSAPPPAHAAEQAVKILPGPMLFRHEDSQGGQTAVVEATIVTPRYSRTVRTLLTNGKFQGDDDPDGQVNAQFGFAALPTLFVDRRDRALLIGLGTGHTATVLRRLGYREIHIAEFASGIVQAARQYFAGLNEGVLSDPKVRLHLEDGRNVLLTDSERRYDLITIEISSVWFAGATNLYSREFYDLARRRLKPGGVLQQWVQLHHTGPREIACDLATARSVFPHVSLWYYGAQGLLIASDRPLVLTPNAAATIEASGMAPADAARLVSDLSGSRLLGDEGAAALVRDLRPEINTDNNRWIEYASPRYQASSFDWTGYNLRRLAKYQ